LVIFFNDTQFFKFNFYITHNIASIISKKAAAGIKYLVLDIKIGSASFFHSVDEAKTFGKQFVSSICKVKKKHKNK
jgi:thymidine phosphorylase